LKGNGNLLAWASLFNLGENNQFLNDDGSSQKLTKDAIMDLKAKGVEGEVFSEFFVHNTSLDFISCSYLTKHKTPFYQDIIERLIENSETFEKKTEFSQEKYLNKKRKR
jgi:tRNA (adenine-N(1)-)-methyltransferase non-catalytic subunit